jgi:16S rRNA (guanine966-N2)-methyltransferase
VPGNATRPVTDRVKESLFNIIGADVQNSSWWDMFAGTGAIGIEALSRGAAFVRFTDSLRSAVDTVRANLRGTRLGMDADVRQTDAFRLIAAPPDRTFDYVYVAPPQYRDLWLRAVSGIDENAEWLSEDGWVVIQIHPKEFQVPALRNLLVFDERRYGTTLLVFMRRPPAKDPRGTPGPC